MHVLFTKHSENLLLVLTAGKENTHFKNDTFWIISTAMVGNLLFSVMILMWL